jgi:AhpD family alkylhydroperoxidase
MPHIQLPEGLPGIRGLFAFSPATARPLCELAEGLLHTPSTLTLAERELIATYVSSQNDCYYCQTSHGAIAAHHLGGNEELARISHRTHQSSRRQRG